MREIYKKVRDDRMISEGVTRGAGPVMEERSCRRKLSLVGRFTPLLVSLEIVRKACSVKCRWPPEWARSESSWPAVSGTVRGVPRCIGVCVSWVIGDPGYKIDNTTTIGGML